ncbi:MAG TPA: DUF3800 domain-containing protein [Candidatus Omnitrophota bacterium]|nr:DUF3800 domain-containing protein [Candidatus Omnitrophota bacterium]
MLYLYLDESGDLGFDFVTKKPSKYFTLSVLVVKGQKNNRAIINTVKHTFKRKLHKKKLLLGGELKGSKVSLDIKKYFYRQIAKIDFKIYALTLNKKRVNQSLVSVKERLYNYIARLVLDQIDINNAHQRVIFILDRSKGKPEIADFNKYIFDQIKGRLNPQIPLDIVHKLSHEMPGLQAADLFAWGIFRKYEKRDMEWFNVFKGSVIFDDVYLP